MKIILKYWKIFLGICLLVLAGFGVASTLQNNQEKQQQTINEAKKTTLTSIEVTKIRFSTPMQAQVQMLTGTLKPYQILELASETEGKITEIFFENNQYVAIGQVLAKTNAQIKQTQANITELNYKKAKRDFERMEALFKNNNLPEIELENARFQMQNAQQNHILNTQMLDFAFIRTPISGNITQKLATKGKYLQIGTPIAVITDISSLRLQVNVAPQDLSSMKINTKVNIKIPSLNLAEITGFVRSISVQSNEAGSFPVEIIIQNNQQKQLLAGMQAEITTGNNNDNNNNKIMLIPRTALLQNKVFVVENSKAIAKNVVVGREFGNEIEIISGLKIGDEIIIKGQNNVENEQTVQIFNQNIKN